MPGALNFYMSDIYGGIQGTTEVTQPEAADQQALVDDQKSGEQVENTTSTKPGPILLALALIFVIAIVAGGVMK